MTKLKRNQEEKDHKHGYRAAIKGIPKTVCPYEDTQRRASWLNGWRLGYQERIMQKTSVL